MNSAYSFEFHSYNFDAENSKIEFFYNLNVREKIEFKETLLLPAGFNTDIPSELFEQILQSVHLMLGISYWKLYCPKDIKLKTLSLSKEQAEFWNTVYTKGLGEFFYKNNIDFRELISFPYKDSAQPKSVTFPRKDRSLVGIGGGKDSIVTAELLKSAGKEFSSFIVETQKEHTISHEITSLIGAEQLVIKRHVDPQLFELNNDPSTYNGHIPISAVFACIGLLAGVLYDYSYVVVSNERSANYGNTEYLGETINHQWSKTIEFEQMFQEYVKNYITPDLTYFSLLRPYSEYNITEMFTQYPRYFSAFSSCNSNYAINKELPHSKWCGECPKCAFVFIMMAAFLPKDQVLTIFGQNLLDKEGLIPTYKELLGVEGVKPFECVGTPEEVALAFYNVYKKGEYNEFVVMKMFERDVLSKVNSIEDLEKEVLKNGTDLIPEEFKQITRS